MQQKRFKLQNCNLLIQARTSPKSLRSAQKGSGLGVRSAKRMAQQGAFQSPEFMTVWATVARKKIRLTSPISLIANYGRRTANWFETRVT